MKEINQVSDQVRGKVSYQVWDKVCIPLKIV